MTEAVDAAQGVRYSCATLACRIKAKEAKKQTGKKPPQVQVGQPCPHCGSVVN